MMSSIILMSHDLSQPIRTVALDQIQRERDLTDARWPKLTCKVKCIREAIKSHNRLNLGNHPNLQRPPPLFKWWFFSWVIIAKVIGWETTIILRDPPPLLGWFPIGYEVWWLPLLIFSALQHVFIMCLFSIWNIHR